MLTKSRLERFGADGLERRNENMTLIAAFSLSFVCCCLSGYFVKSCLASSSPVRKSFIGSFSRWTGKREVIGAHTREKNEKIAHHSSSKRKRKRKKKKKRAHESLMKGQRTVRQDQTWPTNKGKRQKTVGPSEPKDSCRDKRENTKDSAAFVFQVQRAPT